MGNLSILDMPPDVEHLERAQALFDADHLRDGVLHCFPKPGEEETIACFGEQTISTNLVAASGFRTALKFSLPEMLDPFVNASTVSGFLQTRQTLQAIHWPPATAFFRGGGRVAHPMSTAAESDPAGGGPAR